jgi:hypothetical protein
MAPGRNLFWQLFSSALIEINHFLSRGDVRNKLFHYKRGEMRCAIVHVQLPSSITQPSESTVRNQQRVTEILQPAAFYCLQTVVLRSTDSNSLPVALVCERTILTERRPLVGDDSVNFSG